MRKIMIVDDDGMVLSAMVHLVEISISTNDNVAAFTDPLEAANENFKEYTHIITDYMMPRMTGEELLDKAMSENPELNCLIITGSNVTLRSPYALTLKPCELRVVRDFIRCNSVNT